MSERLIVNFTPGGKPVTHGGAGTAYANYGCRCDECTLANRFKVARRQAERRYEKVPSEEMHGKQSTYINWSCRCEPCSAAHSAVCKRNYYNRKEEAGRS